MITLWIRVNERLPEFNRKVHVKGLYTAANDYPAAYWRDSYGEYHWESIEWRGCVGITHWWDDKGIKT